MTFLRRPALVTLYVLSISEIVKCSVKFPGLKAFPHENTHRYSLSPERLITPAELPRTPICPSCAAKAGPQPNPGSRPDVTISPVLHHSKETSDNLRTAESPLGLRSDLRGRPVDQPSARRSTREEKSNAHASASSSASSYATMDNGAEQSRVSSAAEASASSDVELSNGNNAAAIASAAAKADAAAGSRGPFWNPVGTGAHTSTQAHSTAAGSRGPFGNPIGAGAHSSTQAHSTATGSRGPFGNLIGTGAHSSTQAHSTVPSQPGRRPEDRGGCPCACCCPDDMGSWHRFQNEERHQFHQDSRSQAEVEGRRGFGRVGPGDLGAPCTCVRCPQCFGIVEPAHIGARPGGHVNSAASASANSAAGGYGNSGVGAHADSAAGAHAGLAGGARANSAAGAFGNSVGAHADSAAGAHAGLAGGAYGKSAAGVYGNSAAAAHANLRGGRVNGFPGSGNPECYGGGFVEGHPSFLGRGQMQGVDHAAVRANARARAEANAAMRAGGFGASRERYGQGYPGEDCGCVDEEGNVWGGLMARKVAQDLGVEICAECGRLCGA